MMRFFKKVVKKVLGINKPLFYWKGNYITWQEAKNSSIGYDDDLIIDKVFQATKLALTNDDWFERDGTIIKQHRINPLLLTSLYFAKLSNQQNAQFNVLDFGGALGSIFYQHEFFFKIILGIKWNIIEQEKLNKLGVDFFTSESIKFFQSIDEYKKEVNETNVVVLSSVLQYLENPYLILDQLISLKSKYIIVDLTVFEDLETNKKDIITIQHVGKAYYGKAISYPCWIFNRSNFLKYISKDYKVILSDKSYFGEITFEKVKLKYSFFLLERVI